MRHLCGVMGIASRVLLLESAVKADRRRLYEAQASTKYARRARRIAHVAEPVALTCVDYSLAAF